VLPAELRRRDGVTRGQYFKIERVGTGMYRLVRDRPRRNEGLVKWLLACPAKSFFHSSRLESDAVLREQLTSDL